MTLQQKKKQALHLDTIVDNIPGYIYRHKYGSGYSLEFVKGDCESITGYNTTELENVVMDAEEIIHPDDREEIWDIHLEKFRSSGKFDLTYRIITRSGDLQWVRDQGHLVRDIETGEEFVDGFITDISTHWNHENDTQEHQTFLNKNTGQLSSSDRNMLEQQRREQELERTNAILSTLFDTLPAGVFAEDADRNILTINDRMFDLLDMTGAPEGIIGTDREQLAKRVSDRYAESEEFVKRIVDIHVNQEPVINEEVVLEDGRVFTRSHHPIDLSTGEGRLWMYRDITEYKDREKKLQQERDRFDEFAGVVTHDLRNPLNVAMGRLTFVQDNCQCDVRNYLDTIQNALHRIERITENVLWLAREGRDIGSVDSVLFHDAIDDAWEMVANNSKEAEMRYDRSDAQTIAIAADGTRLQQLLENLFRNAIDHVGTGVTVTVGLLDGGFYIEDNGNGIPEGRRKNVFSAGYSTAQNGTGFGLRIVKQIADAHGWTIQITDGSDGGARFEITGIEEV